MASSEKSSFFGVDSYYLIPGKTGGNGTYLPLWMHLKDTADVIEYLCRHRIADSVLRACGLNCEEFQKVCVFLAMVHDIGKCTPLFIAKLLVFTPWLRDDLFDKGLIIPDLFDFIYAKQSPHTRAGEEILKGFKCPDGICSIIGAHHGKPTSESDIVFCTNQLKTYPFNYYAKQEELWKELQEKCLRNALDRAGYPSVSDLPILSNCAQMLLCGLLIQADWIASNQTYFPLLSSREYGFHEMYPHRTERALAELSLPELWHAVDAPSENDIYAKRFGFTPSLMQRRAAETAKALSSSGLMIIEAQMGTGKTEAALAAAEIMSAKYGAGGIFFGLPTQATSNGIFPRLTDWATTVSQDGTHSIRLVHGTAEMNEDYRAFYKSDVNIDDDSNDRLMAHKWFSKNKQALLADFVVGTVDTALMMALSQKHVMLRHLGLCGKTVIIDECHAYDVYMSKYLNRMLRWLGEYHVPVILLSATLPLKKKEEMLRAYTNNKKLKFCANESYPLITWAEQGEVFSTAITEAESSTQVQIRRFNEINIADELKSKLKDGGCAGIIVNTVKRAQAISEDLRRRFPDKKIYVHHAQFLAEDRIRREKELIRMIGKRSVPETRNNVIVVGTQVLEQSLDIDFDYLITDLCPMDLLLQRIGRLHRHERTRPAALENAACSVMCADGEFESGGKAIYGKWLLKQTNRFLPDNITLPSDIPRLVNQVYAEPVEEIDDPDWEDFRDRTGIKESKAEAWLLQGPRKSRREQGNSIVGMLDKYLNSEKTAEAKVRDGLPSFDVLVMREADDGRIGFLPWISNKSLRADTTPSDEEGRKIAMQRLRLPFAFCIPQQLDETIDELEKENADRLYAWQDSPWLKGELVLVLNRSCEKELCGFKLKYDKNLGLTYERSDD